MTILKHFRCTVIHCSSGVLSAHELFLDAAVQAEVSQLHIGKIVLLVHSHEHVVSLQVVMYDAVGVTVLYR